MKKLLILTSVMFLASCAMDAQTPKRTKVQINTTQGEIVVELYNETPVHRDNFVKLVKEKYYDSVLFHRCIRSFMIQAGDPDSRRAKPGEFLGSGGVDYTLPAEIRNEFAHTRGALAAARLGDNVNPEKRSSGCQFYIVQGQEQTPDRMDQLNANRYHKYTPEQVEEYVTIGGTPHLDGGYTVFGRVIKGLDVVEKISLLPSDNNNRPLEDVRILKMKVIK